ncbi:putative addiction module antidote protein [Undibacterium sp. CY18W]|uniref:Addiction module antidote protein n=1 Tax=Undibacterium hunanense TaxID=2762292 RepID=A0ABR6ZWZ1_9BURK|nr:putative addiction module antidote protein [Undibacterium hunanense]
MKPQTSTWDVTDYLKTEEDQALYLDACIEEADGDVAFIAKALGDIARARGMSQIASDTGLSRESLYKALSVDGNPSFATILKVMKSLGLELHATTRKSSASTSAAT